MNEADVHFYVGRTARRQDSWFRVRDDLTNKEFAALLERDFDLHVRCAFSQKRMCIRDDLITRTVLEGAMEYQARTQIDKASGKFSILDWPTPATLVPAHRARAEALREVLVWLAKRTKSALTAVHVVGSTWRQRQTIRQ